MAAGNCKNCGNPLNDLRHDAQFCDPRCTAQWTRDNGYHRERFHAERQEQNMENCQFCGNEFFFNSYADRGGQRQPRFCSNKCRQADYRKRHKESSFAGGANSWQDGRNDKQDRKGTKASDERTERQKQDDEDNRRAEEQRARYRAEQTYKDTSRTRAKAKDTSQSETKAKDTSRDKRWSSKDPYVVLGVTYLSPLASVKKAWMKLVREWHPDVCKHPDATFVTQSVNAAWDKLKNK